MEIQSNSNSAWFGVALWINTADNRHRHNILLLPPLWKFTDVNAVFTHKVLKQRAPIMEIHFHHPSFCISLPGHFYHCSFCKIIFLANSSPKSFGTSVGTRCSDVQRLFRSNYINKSNSLKESFYIMSKDDLPGSSEPLTLLLPQNRGFHTGKLFSLSF